MNNKTILQAALALTVIFGAVTSQADIFGDLNKLRRGARIIKDLAPAKGYVCVADTSFYGSYVAENKNKEIAKAEAENKCLAAGVSWVYCTASCTKK